MDFNGGGLDGCSPSLSQQGKKGSRETVEQRRLFSRTAQHRQTERSEHFGCLCLSVSFSILHGFGLFIPCLPKLPLTLLIASRFGKREVREDSILDLFNVIGGLF